MIELATGIAVQDIPEGMVVALALRTVASLEAQMPARSRCPLPLKSPATARREGLAPLLVEQLMERLTEGYQLDPEQSTSAIVVHHPQANGPGCRRATRRRR